MAEEDALQLDELETPLGRLTLVADSLGRLRLVGWIDGHERLTRALSGITGAVSTLRRVDHPSGLSYARSRAARPAPTPSEPGASGGPRPCAPLGLPEGPIPLGSWCPATG